MASLKLIWTEELLHERLAPYTNTQYSWRNLTDNGHNPNLQRLHKAAILIPLEIRDNEIYIWLTLRSDDVSHDKGHVSFPGGMRDDKDQDAIATCLRESREEIGLLPNQVTIISEHVPQINSRGIAITPIVGLISPGFVPQPNGEVSKCFSLPLPRFLSRTRHEQTIINYLRHGLQMNFFTDQIEGKDIVTWGLTAGFSVSFAVAVLREMPEFSYPITIERPFAIQEDHIIENEKIIRSKM